MSKKPGDPVRFQPPPAHLRLAVYEDTDVKTEERALITQPVDFFVLEENYGKGSRIVGYFVDPENYGPVDADENFLGYAPSADAAQQLFGERAR
jgi:hypothetical protein